MTTETLPRGNTVALDRDRKPPAGATGEIMAVPLELIDVDVNVRVNVASIEELAASIAEHGVRQPISLRDTPGDRYAINFGQRRYLASKLAGRETIPAFIDNEGRTSEQLAIHQLVENLAREDLPPLDRARAMRTVVDAGMTQADLARQLGIGATTVTNDLRLLEASPAVHAALEAGQITASHAKALLPLPVKEQDSFVGRIRQGGMSIATSQEERDQAKAKLAEKTDEQLQVDLSYWAVATADHEDRFNELTNERAQVGELHTEARTWLALVTRELQKRRPKPVARGGLS